ncbi:Porin subfamily [Hoeflea sp. IMCC20628]|uniref:porin n=1 Tax=Hoeflea sp. IMCC20628 TaxID=1620421 RepID=UPI00063ABAA2|nr:porin [Hoeflea sp. IMCC20628]AKH99862.1 Porin subfamily [Hoeflea sp. IMCC20628]
MNIKSLLLGSAAALVAVSGARAADAIVAAEPEPVEYVRVCDAFGTGYFYIPGTETCLRIHGYVRYDVGAGDLFSIRTTTGDDTYFKRARFSFRVSTASETEMGTLRTYVETRWQYDTNQNFVGLVPAGYNNANEFSVNFAWIQLGGLRVGKDESLFTTFTGYAGAVINDGSYGPFDTNLISYTYNGGAFRAALAVEQGVSDDGTTNGTWGIDDYMPHVVGGVGYNAGMFDVSAVVGFDTRDDIGLTVRGGYAAKLRADVTINDQASLFAMIMYGENSSGYTTWGNGLPGSGLATDDTLSVIGGGSYKASDRLTFNMQAQWIDSNVALVDDAWSVVGNLNYTVVPGLVVTPEVVWADDGVNDAFGFYGRVQRSF